MARCRRPRPLGCRAVRRACWPEAGELGPQGRWSAGCAAGRSAPRRQSGPARDWPDTSRWRAPQWRADAAKPRIVRSLASMMPCHFLGMFFFGACRALGLPSHPGGRRQRALACAGVIGTTVLRNDVERNRDGAVTQRRMDADHVSGSEQSPHCCRGSARAELAEVEATATNVRSGSLSTTGTFNVRHVEHWNRAK